MKYRVYNVNKIAFIEVTNLQGLKVIFTSAGAGILDIYLNDQKITDNALDEKSYLIGENFYGKTLSLNLNDEDVEFDGSTYHLESKMALNRLLFSAKPMFDDNAFLIQYLFNKKYVKGGLPGNIKQYVTYAMNDQSNKLIVEYRVISDKKTLIKMHHIYKFVEDATLINEKELQTKKHIITISGDQKFVKAEEGILSVSEDDAIKGLTLTKRISYEFRQK